MSGGKLVLANIFAGVFFQVACDHEFSEDATDRKKNRIWGICAYATRNHKIWTVDDRVKI